VYKTQEGYKTFLDDAFTLLLVLKLAKPWLKVGIHILKKTAYLLGTCGGGDFVSELMHIHRLADELIMGSTNIRSARPHRLNQVALLKAAMDYAANQ
jgi:hypothetical protein